MDFDTIYNMILTVGMGAITFFLKRSFDKLDSRASHSDVEELKKSLPAAQAAPMLMNSKTSLKAPTKSTPANPSLTS